MDRAELPGAIIQDLGVAFAEALTAAAPALLTADLDGLERRLQGLVGDYTLRRPYSTCPACHTGFAPLDAALGLGAGALSPGLGRVACRLGIEHAFGAAADQVAEALGVTVAAEAVRRITEGVGAVAEAEQQAQVARVQRGQALAPVPRADDAAGPPHRLVVAVDGVQAPLLDGRHDLKVRR